jgi:hypothetical protein
MFKRYNVIAFTVICQSVQVIPPAVALAFGHFRQNVQGTPKIVRPYEMLSRGEF